MIIAGFQALSLLDYPGKCCSIVFTQGCPFRCPYCHNPELVPTRPTTTITEESVIRYLMEHRDMIDGVCITGGEPTIQVGLRRFIEHIKGIGLLVKLDTNGVSPKSVQELVADNLVDYIAMDLKQTWDKYQDVIRSGGTHTVDNCRETFQIIQESAVDHEFRTTILPGSHTEADFCQMLGYLKNGETYFIQETRFKKTLTPNLQEEKALNAHQLAQKLQELFPRLIITSR
jgi:pyruvate formate lyase activating enzyme